MKNISSDFLSFFSLSNTLILKD